MLFLLPWETKKLFVQLMSENVWPVFSSRSFMMSCLMFKSLRHCEFIFVYGVRVRSSFTDLVCDFNTQITSSLVITGKFLASL